MEQDRSRHAVCKLKTALRLVAGREVRVPALAFPVYNPSRLHRALQMANSAINIPFSILSNRTIVSGTSLAYLTGDLEYFADGMARRGICYLTAGRPFFITPGSAAESLRREIGCDLNPKPRIRFSSQCVLIVMASYQGIPAVFRVGECAEARAEVLRQAAGVRLARLAEGFKNLAPRPLWQYVTASGLNLSIETAVPGAPLPFDWKRIDAVSELCLTNSPTKKLARPSLPQELAQVCEAFPAHRDSLFAIAGPLLRWHSDSRMLGCMVHSDLWTGNVLFSGDNLTGIIDWEWSRPDGFPFVDPLHLLLMSYSVDRKVGIAETLRTVWTDGIQDGELNRRLAAVGRRFGFLSYDLKFALLALWFNYLRERIIRGRMPSLAWTEDILPRTMPVIKAWLAACERGTSEAAAASRTKRSAIPGI